jgi:hypothetical protein
VLFAFDPASETGLLPESLPCCRFPESLRLTGDIGLRSNSATAAMIVTTARPSGPPVSTCSRKLMNSMSSRPLLSPSWRGSNVLAKYVSSRVKNRYTRRWLVERYSRPEKLDFWLRCGGRDRMIRAGIYPESSRRRGNDLSPRADAGRMECLRQSELRSLLDFVRGCYTIPQSANFDDFAQWLVTALPRLIPCAHATCNEMNPGTSESLNYVNTPELSSSTAGELWEHHMHEHPVLHYVLETEDRGAMRISDLWSRSQLRNSGLHHDFYRHYGISDALTLSSPTVGTPTTAPKLKQVAPINLGVIISFGGGSVQNGSGQEEFTSYNVEWSTTTTGFGTANSATFASIGTNANVWILNNGIKQISGSFANGTAYYFRVQGVLGTNAGPWTYWEGPNDSCGSTSCATTVTIGEAGASSGWDEVQGTVYIPSSVTPTGPLYVGYFDQNTKTPYAAEIASPTNSAGGNAFTVYVPNGDDYIFFGILDQFNEGLIQPGDVTNVNGNNSQPVAISGPETGQDITLPTAEATATVTTQFNQYTYNNNGTPQTSTNYGLSLNVREGNQLPVAVTIASGPNIISPIDLSNSCGGCGTPQFEYFPNLNSTMPNVGDTYTFGVTYSGGTTETLTAAVTAVLTTSQMVSAMAPNPSSTGVSTTPTSTWTYPANPGNYTYQYYLQSNVCSGNCSIWDIPSNNSSANGFTYTQIPQPPGLVFGTDPTDSTNTPSVSVLTSGDQYNWQVTTIDSNGNQATIQVYFTTQ